MIIQWTDFLHRKPLYKPEVISISILLFSSIGMISPGRMHLYLALLFRRDYFAPVRCIPIWLFCSTGIISASQIHPCLALLFRRDYFRRLNSSLSCTFSPQGLFPPAKFIPTLLFCSTRIISASQIHPCLALLFRRDYFDRPDVSHHWKTITGRPSLKTSLPGHSVKFHFVLLIPLLNSMHTMACPASHKPMALCSSSSSLIFLSSPPAYPVKLPSAPTTRWHGMMIEMGLRPTAPPTACADILDIPCFRAMCPAISP